MRFHNIVVSMVSISMSKKLFTNLAILGTLFLFSGAVFSAGTTTGQSSGAVYCCNDASGRQVCGDLLPQACFGRAYREVGRSGSTIRNVPAPLTAEQRAQRKIEEEKRKIEEEKRKEQDLKDRALLNTYGSEAEIDAMQARAERDILLSIKNAEAKIESAKQARKKYEEEAEFYKKKPMPPEVQKGLKEGDVEINAQTSLIEAKKKELETVRAKYGEEKARFAELSKRPHKR